MLRRRAFRTLSIVLLTVFATYAKDPPSQVIVWPESGTLVLRFTFGRFKEIGSSGGQHSYITDTIAENL